MICEGESHAADSASGWHTNTNLDSGIGRDCMSKKGYVVVPADLATLKQQDLAAKAAEKAQREAAAAAPPPPPPPPPVAPKQVAAKPKPKPKPQQVRPTAQPAPIWPAPAPQLPPS